MAFVPGNQFTNGGSVLDIVTICDPPPRRTTRVVRDITAILNAIPAGQTFFIVHVRGNPGTLPTGLGSFTFTMNIGWVTFAAAGSQQGNVKDGAEITRVLLPAASNVDVTWGDRLLVAPAGSGDTAQVGFSVHYADETPDTEEPASDA